jgi:glutathionylspermidine synthase
LANQWYLIGISQKYGLDTHEFLACFSDAWIHEECLYGDFLVHCRQKMENSAFFLVTRHGKVIAQLSLTEPALKRLANIDFKSYPWNESTQDNRNTENLVDMQIKDVDVNTKRANLEGMVVEKSATKRVYSRFSGTAHNLSTAMIRDKTGSIGLSLWNDQIDTVSLGDTVRIENGLVKVFRGQLGVSVGKKSKLNVRKLAY